MSSTTSLADVVPAVSATPPSLSLMSPPLRVAAITLEYYAAPTVTAWDQQLAPVLLCAAAAEHRYHDRIISNSSAILCNTTCTSKFSSKSITSSSSIPPALMRITVKLPWVWRNNTPRIHNNNPLSTNNNAKTSIIGLLATDFPALIPSLQVLSTEFNDSDESDVLLGAFVALATHLRELTFHSCGITSLRALEGRRGEYLRKLTISGCSVLNSLDGLQHHAYLEELDASWTPIPSIEPLRTCPSLTKVDIRWCKKIASIESLEGHQRLQDVLVSSTAITSVLPLRTCPALVKVDLYGCRQLASLEGLEGLKYLEAVTASYTPITSLEPLRLCPALTTVSIAYCLQLPANIDYLPSTVNVIRYM